MLTTYLERNVVSEIDVGFPLHAPTFDDDLYIIIANEFGMASDDDRPWNGEILLAAVRVGGLGIFFFVHFGEAGPSWRVGWLCCASSRFRFWGKGSDEPR